MIASIYIGKTTCKMGTKSHNFYVELIIWVCLSSLYNVT